ncbi:putative endonuclease [Propionibacteriaceae bacterium ES.041]|uniref:GIY-YIG domain-containing protein n=1 Tax=Enemella evansiae TaxID=2016499 RepID=A0A255FYF4_9ACTN|nr:GIY-YIG nuclease family protein [Enemella evansiae]OYO08720.1 hypothetical protein CGZ94_19615 [Enemella evansiae]PFG66419.1 putative endonuclease [Propionibacteriaceae bacterium ES.041]
MAWVYILECSDGTYYVGSCRNLEHRLAAHHAGSGAVYTRSRRPVALVWAQEFERIDEAWAMERRLHPWSRAKKRALIEGRFDALPGLSRSAYRR